MKMKALTKHFRIYTTVLILLSSSTTTYSQTIDSIGVTKFFSIENLPKITKSSRDSIFKLIGKDEGLRDTYYYYKARLKLSIGQFDEALKLTNVRLAKLPGKLSEFRKAKYYNIIGSVHLYKGKAKQAMVLFEKALRLCEDSNQDEYAAKIENNIANAYFLLVDYESAYKHASNGYELMKAYPENDFYNKLVANLSISEAKVGKMTEAKKHGKIALEGAKEREDILAIVVANLALGEVANSERSFKEAKEYFTVSLELSEKHHFRQFILLNSIGLTVAHLEMKNYLIAVEFGEKALALIDQVDDKTSSYSIKKYLAAAYFGINKPTKAFILMREAHEVFRETNNSENKKAINNILLKYDSEKKEKELIFSKNELLQKKIEQNNLMSILGLLVVLIIALAFIIGFIRHRNKSRIALINSRQEKEVIQAVFDGEEIERERIARELHDGVASDLTAVRYQLMANDRISKEDKTQLEGILLKAHEDTRRLSHNLAPFSLETFGFEKALDQFAQENSTENCQVFATITPTGASISKEKASILYRVAQELTQNAIKHAEATEISIQVLIDEEMTLIVEDDGVGFDFNSEKGSNGMSSISKRGTQLNGTFEVDSNPNHGTVATFTIS
jgi:signal transduction histidine kinase